MADSILVAWNDGRMGNRQTKRMTKQRRHRKPISKAAHHRGLGKGADETHRRMDTLHATRGDVDRGHQDQQASRDYPHPTRPIRSEEHTSELQSLMRTSYAVLRFTNTHPPPHPPPPTHPPTPPN